MNYFAVFTDALKTFWRHKSLWLFGIVMALAGQGEYRFSVNYRESYSFDRNGVPTMPTIPGSEIFLKILDHLWLYFAIFMAVGVDLLAGRDPGECLGARCDDQHG